MMDEEAGEVFVMQDKQRSCIEVHIRGTSPDGYRVIRLAHHEARRLAALILFQAERLGSVRQQPADEDLDVRDGLKTA